MTKKHRYTHRRIVEVSPELAGKVAGMRAMRTTKKLAKKNKKKGKGSPDSQSVWDSLPQKSMDTHARWFDHKTKNMNTSQKMNFGARYGGSGMQAVGNDPDVNKTWKGKAAMLPVRLLGKLVGAAGRKGLADERMLMGAGEKIKKMLPNPKREAAVVMLGRLLEMIQAKPLKTNIGKIKDKLFGPSSAHHTKRVRNRVDTNSSYWAPGTVVMGGTDQDTLTLNSRHPRGVTSVVSHGRGVPMADRHERNRRFERAGPASSRRRGFERFRDDQEEARRAARAKKKRTKAKESMTLGAVTVYPPLDILIRESTGRQEWNKAKNEAKARGYRVGQYKGFGKRAITHVLAGGGFTGRHPKTNKRIMVSDVPKTRLGRFLAPGFSVFDNDRKARVRGAITLRHEAEEAREEARNDRRYKKTGKKKYAIVSGGGPLPVGAHSSLRVLGKESNMIRRLKPKHNDIRRQHISNRYDSGESHLIKHITGKQYGVDKFDKQDLRKLRRARPKGATRSRHKWPMEVASKKQKDGTRKSKTQNIRMFDAGGVKPLRAKLWTGVKQVAKAVAPTIAMAGISGAAFTGHDYGKRKGWW